MDLIGVSVFPLRAEKVEIERESGVDGGDKTVDYSGCYMDYGSDWNPSNHSGIHSWFVVFPHFVWFSGKNEKTS